MVLLPRSERMANMEILLVSLLLLLVYDKVVMIHYIHHLLDGNCDDTVIRVLEILTTIAPVTLV